MQPILLRTALPELAAELEHLLRGEGKAELAEQVSQLEIVSRCRCGDDFCSTFYTRGSANACNPIPETVVLSPRNGVVKVDITSGRITSVELSYRPDVEEKLGILMQR